MAILGSWALALHAAGAPDLPGCGAGAGCAQLTSGPWGVIPGLGLPVSILGAAYFTALAALFILRSARGAQVRWTIRVGAVASVAFVAVMAASWQWCPYCVLVHAGNFILLTANERACRDLRPDPLRRTSLTLASLLGLATLISLTIGWTHARNLAAATSAASLKQSTQRILASPNSATSPPTSATSAFRGRYLQGPDLSPVRIVVFTDFQCEQCRLVEALLQSLSQQHPQIQLSIKHFPLCTDCNRGATSTLHANACVAALAVESAGAVAGPTAYWRAATWAFGLGGNFSHEDFITAAQSWGLDAAGLRAALADPGTLDLIKRDVNDGLSLGVARTPTIYINGVELRGWETQGAIASAVQQILAASPAPSTGDSDRPPDATAKVIADWRSAPRSPAASRFGSPTNAPVRIVIFGDYQDTNTAEADAILREYAKTWPSTTYEFRHYPASSTCNPRIKINPHPLACRMARTAEAARMLGGAPAFERVHEWLFLHRLDYSDADVRALATELLLEPSVLVAANKDVRVIASVDTDIQAGNNLALASIPAIYINERLVPAWKTDTGETLTQILDLAALEPPPASPSPPQATPDPSPR